MYSVGKILTVFEKILTATIATLTPLAKLLILNKSHALGGARMVGLKTVETEHDQSSSPQIVAHAFLRRSNCAAKL